MLRLVALGNPDRGDDGAPIALARLAARLAPFDVEVLEIREPFDLLELLGSAPTVVLDAARLGLRPGSVVEIDPDRVLPRSPAGGSGSHSFDVASAIRLAAALGRAEGFRGLLVVEGEDFSNVRGLSASIEEALPGAAGELVELLVLAASHDPSQGRT